MLGMALAHLFDIKDPADLLRGFSNVLNEFEGLKDISKEKDENDRPRMVRVKRLATNVLHLTHVDQRLFRTTRIPKRQAGATDYGISYADASDAPYLTMPHVVRAIVLCLFAS